MSQITISPSTQVSTLTTDSNVIVKPATSVGSLTVG